MLEHCTKYQRFGLAQFIVSLSAAALLIVYIIGPGHQPINNRRRWSHMKMIASPKVDIAKHQRWTISEKRKLCTNNTGKQWIIIAPVKAPTIQMLRYAKLQAWTLLIVEVKGTPETWQQEFSKLSEQSAAALPEQLSLLVFLDRQQQKNLGFASFFQGDKTSQSRNIGNLYAIMCGGEVIMEVEEDVERYDEAAEPVQYKDSGPLFQAHGDSISRLVNPYALFGQPEMWPRGFPLEAVSNATFEFRKVQHSAPHQESMYKPLIESSMVDDFPTTAAVLDFTQLAHTGPRTFYKKPQALAIQPGYFAPLALGSTTYSSAALWALPLLAGPSEALMPAWRSLWVQKLLWDVGGQLLIVAPSSKQNRSEHIVHLHDFLQEEEGCQKVKPMVDFLHKWQSNEEVFSRRMLALASDLKDAGYWAQIEVDSMVAWVDDLVAVGYVFPDMQPAQRQAVPSTMQSPKKRLAAFCFTGQADRAPQAIPETLTQLQKLLTANRSQQEALLIAEELEHSRAEDGTITFAHDTFAYVSTHKSSNEHIRWVAQQPFTYSILYNDPVLEVPYPLDPARFALNPIQAMLYQLHAQQQCYEMVQDFSRLHNIVYALIVRLRTDHRLHNLVDDASFALWRERSRSAVIIPMPSWDFSQPQFAVRGYQDRIGWGPFEYMGIYMKRWSQFFNKTHMESDAPFHGESSLGFALTNNSIPVERLADDQLQYREICGHRVGWWCEVSVRTP